LAIVVASLPALCSAARYYHTHRSFARWTPKQPRQAAKPVYVGAEKAAEKAPQEKPPIAVNPEAESMSSSDFNDLELALSTSNICEIEEVKPFEPTTSTTQRFLRGLQSFVGGSGSHS
jgi:hypothetical protein